MLAAGGIRAAATSAAGQWQANDSLNGGKSTRNNRLVPAPAEPAVVAPAAGMPGRSSAAAVTDASIRQASQFNRHLLPLPTSTYHPECEGQATRPSSLLPQHHRYSSTTATTTTTAATAVALC